MAEKPAFSRKLSKQTVLINFKAAILIYRDLMEEDFRQSQGDDLDLKTPKQNIVKLFRNCLKGRGRSLRTELLYITLRELTRPFLPSRLGSDGDNRLIASVRNRAIELVTQLERIK